MKNKNELMDESVEAIDAPVETNAGCQVRRKIEELLERRRSKDELGELDDALGLAD
ncbi:MAG: hypothetical protein ACD_70C00177G0001 [uncultured bacterium]|nr:MAG: hypothetical protein ACD_70C00177G0001 [uncultured bacterium]